MHWQFSPLAAALLALAADSASAYWMEDIKHQGISAYAPSPDYTVFRNVRDFGAKGDGVTDDTAAINLAISSGGRCAPGDCLGSTVTPAVVYFPPGTYSISSSIIDYFYTQIIGDPTNLPVIKGASNFSTDSLAGGLIDANPLVDGKLAWQAVNVFFRQIRNLVLDMSEIPAEASALGLHWPSSQATSVNNIVFRMSEADGNQHTGLRVDSGSGGYVGDLVFYGGMVGAEFNNQQYTARNLSFSNTQTAIKQMWNWSWTFKSLSIYNSTVGIEMTSGSTGSMTVLDSKFTKVTGAGIKCTYGSSEKNPHAGSLLIENTVFKDVPKILVNSDKTIMAGSDESTVVDGYMNGNTYNPSGPEVLLEVDPSHQEAPLTLKDSVTGKYYERSKPYYETFSASQFVSARSSGAKGDGKTDDTDALNELFASCAAKPDTIVFVDAGTYLVTDTIFIPPGAKIVGEALASIIMASGPKFQDINEPYPVVQVGKPGQRGRIEWSDMVISTRGACAGAKLIEYNLYSPGIPSGVWDVHVRVGGFAGTNLMLEDCPATTDSDVINENCIASHTSLHITESASGLYHENCWIWVSDHDLEDPSYSQITIYAGRGVFIESKDGRIWISGSGSEHHVLYQYQLANTKDIYMGLIQSETPYFQPNPPASRPFPVLPSMSDPDFKTYCEARQDDPAPCEMAWGLRVLSSKDVVVYGAGLYSFFNNYSTSCSAEDAQASCQARIFDIERGSTGIGLVVYNLNTVGTKNMVTRNGVDIAKYSDNMNGFTQTLVMFKDNA
ncbi:Glucan 1,3-beta-glucosidase [Ceratocystis lukuohia]|uniref:Glucan 1,3-beta-glucosidase n=1 Tax=Ceratocystis lukuohia TaxID=2019550 RepID=A0ABR4MCH9_9PEZI